ncbi:hypothetical protein Tco_0882048 [Tanacetum coccineum]
MDSIILISQKNTLAEYMILSGADNRPLMLDKDLYDSWKKKIQADCDLKETNIILQGLPSDIYSLVNHQRVAKDLWENFQLLMQGTSLTKQERECKLYDAFDKFTHTKGESLHQYYLRFTQLINDMNIYKMKMEQFQVNTKFLNSLPPEWSKFVTDVKLVKDLHTTNFDQLHAYLEQYELHANEVRLMRERNSGLAVHVFKQGDNPIDAINKMMSFLSTVVTSRFPSTNNQLRNSSNLRQQATIHDGRVIVQRLQRRQNSYVVGEGYMARQCPKPKRKRDATWFRENVLLVEAQGNGKVLNEEELEFLADPGITEVKAVLIANLSSYGLDVLFEETNAQFADFEKELNNLKQTLSEQSKEKELLTKTFNVFKNESKEKEAKNIDKKIALEKKVKELDNIVKEIVDIAAQIPSANTIVPGMFKLDLEPLAPSLEMYYPHELIRRGAWTFICNPVGAILPEPDLKSLLRKNTCFSFVNLEGPGLHSMTPATSSSGLHSMTPENWCRV